MVLKHPRKRIYFLIAFFIVFTGGALVYGNLTTPDQAKQSSIKKVSGPKKVLAAIDILISPSLSPSPTASSSPTLIPSPVYTGYCLSVPVLLYHHLMPYQLAKEKGQTSLNVDNGIFDQQMGYLASHGYTTIFAEDLVSALKSHTALPAKSIVVTIDDGYADNFTYAFASLKKYNIKTSLMVPTGLMGVNSGANNYYSWSELKEMVQSGLVRAYNHTFSHSPMGTKDAAKDQFEVATAQEQLHSQLGITNTIFTYPYGTNATSEKVHTVLIQNGITGAYSTIGGSYQCDSFIYSLHRLRVGNTSFPAYGIY